MHDHRVCHSKSSVLLYADGIQVAQLLQPTFIMMSHALLSSWHVRDGADRFQKVGMSTSSSSRHHG